MQVTYLFDPLCGWCYGAGPAIERLAALPDIALELAPTGLFTTPRPMDPSFAAYAWQNDQRIAKLTGLPFTEAYRANVLGAEGTMFDSGPATLAIVAIGLTEPAQELAALKRIQHARYENGRNTSNLDAVAAVLEEAGFAHAAQRLRTPDDELLGACRARIAAARADMSQFRADGVPALVAGDGSNCRLIASNLLFGPFDLLTAQLAAA